MIRKEKLPELLAPAGDFECLVAAVAGGADAIYIGAKLFSARAYAKNFDIDEIKRAVSYCHLHGVKLYVTMNVLLYDNELGEALRLAGELYRAGVDALIVADLGLVTLLRERLPHFELHASTQMSVNNSLGADRAYDMGCTRVVLARELSGKCIKEVTEKCKAETEVFLHGALCVCHSGQCLFSSMIGGRSGNRGECAQPCRLPYNNGKYILSLADLSLAGHIRELIDSGVASLKIEGRMKSPDYVYTVTSIYRRLLDEARGASREENDRLKRAFSRGDFTDGYFTGKTFSSMTGVRTDEDKRISQGEKRGDFTLTRTPVRAEVKIKLGEPSEMTLYGINTDRCVSAFGDAAEPAKSSPLTPDSVKERLAKMGNTLLSLDKEDITLELDEGVNLSPSVLNGLRREAAEQFEYFGRELPDNFSDAVTKIDTPPAFCDGFAEKRTALFFNTDTLLSLGEGEVSYFDAVFVPLYAFDGCTGKANGVYIPPVIMEDELPLTRKLLSLAKLQGAKYALVGNLSHVALVVEAGLLPVGDFRLNVMNTYTLMALRELGIIDATVSVELTSGQSRRLGGRAVVYGRIPLMITERCFMKDSFGCDRCGKCSLTDRKGVKFPMMRESAHRNLILNSAYTYMGDKPDEMPRDRHFIFTTENAAEVRLIVRAFNENAAFPLNGHVRRMGKRRVD